MQRSALTSNSPVYTPTCKPTHCHITLYHYTIWHHRCNKIDGLNPVVPQGAMYMMIQIQVDQLDIDDDVEFCKAVWAEESVCCFTCICIVSYPTLIVLGSPSTWLMLWCQQFLQGCHLPT